MKLTRLFFIAVLFTACSSGNKKIIVFAKGDLKINNADKTITVKDDGSNVDDNALITESSPVTFQIKKPSGDVPFTLAENGLYVVNAGKDTVIGVYQNYAKRTASDKTISQAELKKDIDSLVALTENKNISAANRNFFILPFQSQKITNNTDAIIVAPYHQMSFVEQKDDKEPEVYRFYNVHEIRELIVNLKAMTVPSHSNENVKTVVIKDKSEQ